MQPILIVLAAGMGSRYGGLKQLDGVGPNGETIMDYSVYDAARSGFGKVVFIIRAHFRSAFEEIFAKRYGDSIEVAFVEQEPEKELPAGFTPPAERTKPWGTGHALLMAEPQADAPFAVINADDFYGREAFRAMSDFLLGCVSENQISQGRYAMIGYKVGNTLSESGGVSRGICSVDKQNFITEVTERHRIRAIAPHQIVFETDPGCLTQVEPDTPVSMNFWGFTPDFFNHAHNAFHTFIHERGQELTSEFYIPTVANQLIQSKQASLQVLNCNASWFGITYQQDRPYVEARIGQLIANGLYPNSIIQK
ncbi:MAG: nucleotidyltransferase [Bacteroidales bacterium]|nr:nucleotidyltransferase [Bacteroidales bacterium]